MLEEETKYFTLNLLTYGFISSLEFLLARAVLSFRVSFDIFFKYSILYI